MCPTRFFPEVEKDFLVLSAGVEYKPEVENKPEGDTKSGMVFLGGIPILIPCRCCSGKFSRPGGPVQRRVEP